MFAGMVEMTETLIRCAIIAALLVTDVLVSGWNRGGAKVQSLKPFLYMVSFSVIVYQLLGLLHRYWRLRARKRPSGTRGVGPS